jgi:hypothetical protein
MCKAGWELLKTDETPLRSHMLLWHLSGTRYKHMRAWHIKNMRVTAYVIAYFEYVATYAALTYVSHIFYLLWASIM